MSASLWPIRSRGLEPLPAGSLEMLFIVPSVAVSNAFPNRVGSVVFRPGAPALYEPDAPFRRAPGRASVARAERVPPDRDEPARLSLVTRPRRGLGVRRGLARVQHGLGADPDGATRRGARRPREDVRAAGQARRRRGARRARARARPDGLLGRHGLRPVRRDRVDQPAR